MPIVGNRHYNDPNIGAAAANLARAFAPPSGSDLAGYATARAKNEEAARLAEIFNYAKNPDFDRETADRLGVLGGLYAPNQSFYGVDTAAATARRGQDIDAQTSIANNRLDNRTAAVTELFGALNPGQVRPAVPENIASLVGLPGVDAVAGAPKPLTESEANAAILQELRQSGEITNEHLVDRILGEETPVKAAGPNGQPIFTSPGAAVRTGAEAFVDPGSTPKPSNGVAVLPTGEQVPAAQDPETGVWRHAQTGEELPPDIQLFNLPTPTGTSSDVGLTTSTQSSVQKRVIAIDQTLDTIGRLSDLIAQSPSSQGLVGQLRGTAQDVIQTGDDLGEFFGGRVAEINEDVRRGLLDSGVAQDNFDPSIPAIDMLQNLLAWQYAKSLSGERVSNEQLRQAREALGVSGLFGNRANSMVRLEELAGQLQRQRLQLNSAGRSDTEQPSGAAPQRLRFDENGSLIE